MPRRRPAQRGQPKIMREGKEQREEKKRKKNQAGQGQGHLGFLWSHLLPLLLHPVLKQPSPASSKRKVKSFLLERLVCLDCHCLPLVGQPLVASSNTGKGLWLQEELQTAGRLAAMLLGWHRPFPVCSPGLRRRGAALASSLQPLLGPCLCSIPQATDPEAQRWGGLGWVGREGEQKEEKGLTSQTKTPEPYFQSSVENIITTSHKLWVYMWG